MEYLDKEGNFDENFYLACLLYPQDLSRNVDIFIEKKEPPTKENHKAFKAIVAKIHDTLYKILTRQVRLLCINSRNCISFHAFLS